MKLFSDYHMHPQGHKHLPYTQELLQPWADHCRSVGIVDFVFTDHDRYCDGIRVDEVRRLNEKNSDLTIGLGVELDNDPETAKAGRLWVEKNWEDLDFVLGSAHFFTGEELMFDSADQAGQFERLGVERAYELYFNEIEKMIQLGHIDGMAHLDLVKIHNYFLPNQSPAEVFRPLLELVKKADLSMELSTAGWRKPVKEQYPDCTIVKLAMEMGIPFTVASDAHSYVQPGENYERLKELMIGWGVKEVAVYRRHRRQLVSLYD
jgi:histidinol-phosphatase (PHP family)